MRLPAHVVRVGGSQHCGGPSTLAFAEDHGLRTIVMPLAHDAHELFLASHTSRSVCPARGTERT